MYTRFGISIGECERGEGVRAAFRNCPAPKRPMARGRGSFSEKINVRRKSDGIDERAHAELYA